jgi:tRNA 2-thiouridine synthesizing protein A
MPTLLLERALRAAAPGSILVAVATDPMAEVDLPFSAQKSGARVLEVRAEAGSVFVRVQKE